MIASFFDGRVRIRDKALKDPELMSTIREIVRSQDGILSVEENQKTGSLLVLYNPKVISRKQLLMAARMLEEQLPEKQEEATARPAWNCKLKKLTPRQENYLLIGLGGLAVLSAFISKKMHLTSGVLFTLLAAKHIHGRRRYL